MTCLIEGCENKTIARGLCSSHYQRLRKYGSPFGGRPTFVGEIKEYLYNFVLPYEGEDCIIWPYSIHRGRAYMTLKGRSNIAARIICEETQGFPQDSNLDAAHSCGNKICVNPNHIRWATRKENEADKIIHGTKNQGETVWNSKLRKEDVLKILQLKGEKTGVEVARYFGLHPTTVRMIWRGKRWAHLSQIAP